MTYINNISQMKSTEIRLISRNKTCVMFAAFSEERRARGHTFLEEIQETDDEEAFVENNDATSLTTDQGNKERLKWKKKYMITQALRIVSFT